MAKSGSETVMGRAGSRLSQRAGAKGHVDDVGRCEGQSVGSVGS